MESPFLMLIDALGVAYRAYHAIPPLAAKDGTPTNALVGFVKTMRLLTERYNPGSVAAVFDGGLPRSRLERLPAYKANRPPMPEALSRQLPLIEEYLESEGISRVCLAGEEADDVIATLADRASAAGGEVRIASTDKDLYQLVCQQIKLVTPTKDAKEIGPAEVEAKTGVPPSLVPDWLALVGDPVDNIPGAPGIGEKTAARLLNEFGSLERLLSQLDSVANERIRASLSAVREDLLRNYELVRLNRAVRGTPSLEALKRGKPDEERLRAFFERLNMDSFASVARGGQLEFF